MDITRTILSSLKLTCWDSVNNLGKVIYFPFCLITVIVVTPVAAFFDFIFWLFSSTH